MERIALKRGDLISARFSRELGKTRPAIVIQADQFWELGTVLLCPLTSDLEDSLPIRVPIDPSTSNGLQRPSRIMVDKIFAVSRERCGNVIGVAAPEIVAMVSQRLLLVLALAD